MFVAAVNRACVRSTPARHGIQSWCVGSPPHVRPRDSGHKGRRGADCWSGPFNGPTGLIQAQASFSGRLAASSATIALLWLPKRQLSCCAHLFKRHTIPFLSPGITATQGLDDLGLPQNSASEVGTGMGISRSSHAWARPSSKQIIKLPTTESHVSFFIRSALHKVWSPQASTFGTQAHPCMLIVYQLIPR